MATQGDRMRTNTIRHLPVVQQGKLVGLIAERDLALIDGLSERKRDKIQVRQLMRIHPFMCGPDDSLIDVVRVMIEHKLGSVIVVEQGVPVGVFTTIDAMRRLVELAQVMELMGSAD